ncbi:hypothetical protein TrLO_g12368 [Triparma laevis f. longispina]|uniref:Flavodoxin-like domain-containing protein n=1 Tax=Triparma laevis f. longispina TaxID=1714387 RepID=A0A9W7FBK9_9STRA|nr:hypothetical protein TrLO_g12368 [Triparma laevis f. longispina]
MKLLTFSLLLSLTSGFISPRTSYLARPPVTKSGLFAKAGVYFGTVTGTTEDIATMIQDELTNQGISCADPVCVDNIQGHLAPVFAKHDTIIAGAPSYLKMRGEENIEQTGTAWDNVLNYDILCNHQCNLDDEEVRQVLQQKHVACFGVGDQICYPENFCDAVGELHSVFSQIGCKMYGKMPIDKETFSFTKSKAVKEGDHDSVGLLIDQDGQYDLTPLRIKMWVSKLVDDGFFA